MFQLYLFDHESDPQYGLLLAQAVRECNTAWLACMVRNLNSGPKRPNQFGAGAAMEEIVVQTWD